ncbi:glycosyl hydrolase family 95 catalytic domain-containing protein [Paenibacillus xylanexedens]|uniref:glycoside hydrolase family 95 protein n=1 Tax=Paenibacillus xylanexedens TaxID=528191 RepID=UPI003B010512
MKTKNIWFNQPAGTWEEALPIGNGTLGGMIFGKTQIERIQLNEDSLWYGGPMQRNNPQALESLSQIRSLIFDGKIREAEELAADTLVGVPDGQRHYEPLGDFYIAMDHSEHEPNEYQRHLDLEHGKVNVNYTADQSIYSRDYFASYPDQVLVVHLKSSVPGKLSFSTVFGRGTVLESTSYSDILKHPVGFQSYLDRIEKRGTNNLIIRGRSGGEEGIRFCCAIRLISEGGQVHYSSGQLSLKDGNSATILITACTDFRVPKEQLEVECLRRIEAASAKPYSELLADHVMDYQSLFEKMDIHLEDENKDVICSELPIDQRLERLRAGKHDPELMSLYFQFGRYLLISSSRPGSLPANLQGIWNKDMLPVWDSKYTININTQMNYWPAESCNLSECHVPLFDFIDRLQVRGKETARTMYGCKGFVAHHNSDIWADAAPQDVCMTSTFWTMGGAWLSLHLWDHYEYNKDVQFLKKVYATMKDAAMFILDYLIEDPTGNWVICPSSSPENRYILDNGESGALCFGASMDNQIIRELFTRCIESTGILQEDQEFGEVLRSALTKIPETSIGKHGQIQEWSNDYDELEPGHRHISHLFALHPGTQITLQSTPDLAKAARVTLDRRLEHGGGHTGWSRAWILNMWARLEESELAHDNIVELLRSSTLPNLFCDHPPFQIDGNFGGTAGIAEMLLQSHNEVIRLLPALPEAWPKGYIRGIRACGGFEIDLEWENGRLFNTRIRSITESRVTVSYLDQKIELNFPGPNAMIELKGDKWNNK